VWFRPRGCRESFDQVHEVRGVFAAVNCEDAIRADLLRILAQHPGADAVVGSGPGQRVGHDLGIVAMTLRAIRSTRLVISEAARRATSSTGSGGVGTLDDQMSDPLGQGVGLSGARSGG
jgi:hypothetical protein